MCICCLSDSGAAAITKTLRQWRRLFLSGLFRGEASEKFLMLKLLTSCSRGQSFRMKKLSEWSGMKGIRKTRSIGRRTIGNEKQKDEKFASRSRLTRPQKSESREQAR